MFRLYMASTKNNNIIYHGAKKYMSLGTSTAREQISDYINYREYIANLDFAHVPQS